MKLGFCGLGLMGAPMVRRLLAAGHQVTVWNRSPGKAGALASAGARVAATPAEAASDADGVLMCVFDAAAVEAVVFGPDGVAQGRGLRWLADHSSIPPDATRAFARRLLRTLRRRLDRRAGVGRCRGRGSRHAGDHGGRRRHAFRASRCRHARLRRQRDAHGRVGCRAGDQTVQPDHRGCDRRGDCRSRRIRRAQRHRRGQAGAGAGWRLGRFQAAAGVRCRA